jgi:hypothetical protein
MSSVFIARHRTGLFALFVLCCTLLAVYLRLDFYPDTYYGDEEIPIAVVAHMESKHSLDTNWASGIWRKPADRWAYGYDQYNFSSYNSVQYYLNRLFQVTKNHTNPAIFNRTCSVVFQVISLVFICYLAQYLAGNYGAIAAGLFFVFNPLLVVDAHYARPESFLIFITTMAIAFHLLAIKQKKQHGFFMSAFMWGIACACKFSLLPMAGLCGLHFLIQIPRQDKKIIVTLLWLFCFGSGVFMLAPYMFINSSKMAYGALALFKQYFNTQSASTIFFERSDLLLPGYLLGYFGAAFWLTTILSPLHNSKFLKCLSMFLLAITFFYIGIFSLLSFFNESNLSHLAVVWCLLLAIAVETCITRARQKTKHIKIFFIIITAATIATPALCSFKIKTEVYNRDAADKIQRKLAVVEKNLVDTHPGTVIIDIKKQPDIVNQTDKQLVIVKVPWMNRNELYTFAQMLSEKHFVLLDEIKLPLNELPHSQLQAIHFPASYRYYQRKNAD